MRLAGVKNKVERLMAIVAHQGTAEAVRRLRRWVYDRFSTSPDSARHYYDQLRKIDADFDNETGMDTGGIIDLYDLNVASPNRRLGNAYMATDPEEFEAAISLIDVPIHESTFVDLGSGKGRVLLLAARHRFKRIIGVEFAEELHLVAVANLERLDGEARVEAIHGDATEYPLPSGTLVIYLCNPFDRPLMASVAKKTMESWRLDRRPMRIIYGKPTKVDCWTDEAWILQVNDPRFAIFAPPDA